MKKILIDLEKLRHPNSGIANVFRNLTKGLLALDSDCAFSFFGKRSELEKISPSISIQDWSKWHRFFDSFSSNYDIIHLSHQLSPYFRRKHKGTTKIVTLHDLNFLYENLPQRKINKRLRRVNAVLKNADYIVCISHFVKQDVLKNKDILQLNNVKEILVIHNGIEFPAEKNYDLGQFSYLKNKPYILNIGVLFNKKNQMALIKMLPYINSDLVLVSSGKKDAYAKEIEEKIQELHLEDRVHFLTNITEEEKYALIQNSESMCHPSTAEGFGIPPIEAMSFGKPVFLSTFTSLPEIGGKAAFYFNNFEPKSMADTYKNGLKNYQEDASLSDKIKQWASQFDYRTMAKNYQALYERV